MSVAKFEVGCVPVQDQGRRLASEARRCQSMAGVSLPARSRAVCECRRATVSQRVRDQRVTRSVPKRSASGGTSRQSSMLRKALILPCPFGRTIRDTALYVIGSHEAVNIAGLSRSWHVRDAMAVFRHYLVHHYDIRIIGGRKCGVRQGGPSLGSVAEYRTKLAR